MQPGAADPLDPVFEAGKGVGAGDVLSQFSKMDRTIRAFCEQSSNHIAQSKRLPQMTHQPLTLPERSPVGKSAHEFTSTEDYVFFTLLSIINTHLYGDIFRPFHPAASAEESQRCEKG
jgi:hypothetical protein